MRWARKKKERKPRGSDPVKTWIRKLDDEFSKRIRTRDCEDGYAACVTCGRVHSYAEMDCGHYIGRQFDATRWEPMNAAAQCRKCNRFEEGRKAEFRAALVKKYGAEAIERMEAMHRMGKKPRLHECEEIMERIRGIK